MGRGATSDRDSLLSFQSFGEQFYTVNSVGEVHLQKKRRPTWDALNLTQIRTITHRRSDASSRPMPPDPKGKVLIPGP